MADTLSVRIRENHVNPSDPFVIVTRYMYTSFYINTYNLIHTLYLEYHSVAGRIGRVSQNAGTPKCVMRAIRYEHRHMSIVTLWSNSIKYLIYADPQASLTPTDLSEPYQH